jgi:hypothetical protein
MPWGNELAMFFFLVANLSWNGKHTWSTPLLNYNMSISPVLKLKNVTSEKYSPINTASALQKAKGLTWDSFLVKTPMFIECLLLHHFLSWSSMIHTSMKLLSLSIQVMTSFPLYSTSLICKYIFLPSEPMKWVIHRYFYHATRGLFMRQLHFIQQLPFLSY